MVPIKINYWAGAKAAARTASETVDAETVTGALDEVIRRRSDSHFTRVIRASTVLIDGTAAHHDDLERVLNRPVEVEILPPFAGG